MKVFYKLCINSPHIKQLNHYAKNYKIQISIYKEKPSDSNENNDAKKSQIEIKNNEESAEKKRYK